MIDFTFHFTESTEEEKQILDSNQKSQGLSSPNIRYFTGRRWNNSGVAAVQMEVKFCTILDVKMQDDVSTEFSDVYYFYESLVWHLLTFVKCVEWKKIGSEQHEEFLKVIAAFDRKVVGEGRVRTAYNAGLVNVADGVLYYVVQKKKVFIRRLQKHRKDKLVTDGDFDKKFKIVFIDRFDDNVAHIYETDDDSYNRVLFSFPGEYTPQDIHVYPFSVGVKELCIKRLVSVYFEKEVPDNRQDFVDYLKRTGCPDIVVDGFIACTAADIDDDIAPIQKYKNVYDFSGNFLRKERKR